MERIELVTPDLSLAYAKLAPIVTEAAAYLECGNQEKAMSLLNKARAMIDLSHAVLLSVGESQVVATGEEAIKALKGNEQHEPN